MGNVNMDYEKLSKKLKGLHTIDSIMDKLNVKRVTAIKVVHLLRKKGYVETLGGGRNVRHYRISNVPIVEVRGTGLYDVINKYSPIKIREPFEHKVVGRKLTLEEALVRAIAVKDFRVILASLALFNHINDWSRLYKFAKEYNVRRKVGALYDVTRLTIKVRRMDKRIRTALLNAKEKDRYIVSKMKSDDFKDVERLWKVYIPFNKNDLRRYKE